MSKQSAVRWLLPLFLFFAIPAHALDIKKEDGVVFISGDIDPKDNRALEKALEGATALVVGNINGGGIDNMFIGFTKLIKGSEVPTVISNKVCGWMCSFIYMAGKERKFGTATPTKMTAVVISKMGVSFNGMVSPWPAYYALLSNQVADAMPRELLRKYTQQLDYPAGLVALPPEEGHPEGTLLECPDLGNSKSCVEVPDLTPLKAGIITSAEVVALPSQ